MYDDHLELSAADADKLATDGPWGDGKFASISPADVVYAAPWRLIIHSAWDMNDLLEAAAVAGRLGFCDTGIALALRAAQLTALAEGEEGDPFDMLNPCIFRRYSMICDEIVADLEDRAASNHFDAADCRRRFWNVRRRQGEAAKGRAARARARRRAAARDNRDYDAEVTWEADAKNAAARPS
jgi:hypothetical protein